MEFSYILRYVTKDGAAVEGVKNQVLITDNYTGDPATTKWTDITGTMKEGVDWKTWETYKHDLSAFKGKKNVVIALHYACAASSGTWEVKNLSVKEATGGTPDTPSKPDTPATKDGITINGLRPDTRQGDAAILEILRRCGARFTRTGQGVVFEKAPLHGTDIDLADCPDLGPVLMVLGLLCEGTTVIRNAERLRIKESDRIEAMETELRACGGQLESEGGTITIHGCAGALHAPEQPLSGHNDHRVVMSLAVLALAAGLALPISGAEAIAKSWPDFLEAIKPLGAEVEHVG